jgi:hypothetical protein
MSYYCRKSILALITIFALASLMPAQAQGTKRKITRADLPAAVLTAFTKDNKAKATNITLVKQNEGQTLYEIETAAKGKKQGWIYAADGSLVETEEAIKLSALPAAVADAVKKEHPQMKIDKAEKVMRDGNIIAYEVEAEKGKEEIEMRIAPDGKVLEHESLKTK